MRTDVLHVDDYPVISFVSTGVTPSVDGFHVQSRLTLAEQTLDVSRDDRAATHITGLSGEGEPALHVESVDARSHPRGDEADHGIVVHMQHVRPHGLSDLADFFRVRGREHGEAVRGYHDF